jgi:hypothetical protein
MSIEAALFTLLSTDSQIASVVKKRIYPVRTPDNAVFPCISYQRTSGQREHHLDGAGSLTFSRFIIEIWTPREHTTGGAIMAQDLARKIQARLDGYKGTVSAVDILGILSENEAQGYESDVEVYRITQTWLIMHREG